MGLFALNVFLKETLIARSTFRDDEVRIGRSTDNDVRLENAAISRYHAAIEQAAGLCVLKDYGSELGTYVNGDRVLGRRGLNDGDRIAIGKFTIVFRGDRPTPTRPDVRDRAAFASATKTIVVKPSSEVRERSCPIIAHLEVPASSEDEPPRLHHLDRDVCSVGSAPGNDLVLEARGVAPRAGLILRGWTGFSVLALAPGLVHNRAPLEGRATLLSRDEVAFGPVRCRFFAVGREGAP